MRITGSSLLGVGYIYFIGYLVSPLFGVDIGSASIVSAFSELPELARAGIKAVLAWPFSFHFCNGIKQLIYDSGWGYPYNKVTMSRNDLYVFAVSAAMAAGLVFGL
jgi:succinate dehydrogenase (ubiquinone) cytochrome b560 subunit